MINSLGSAVNHLLGYTDLHYGNTVAQHNGITVIYCHKCRFAHVKPLPSEEAIRKYYQEQFYQEDKRQYLADEEQDGEWNKKVWYPLEVAAYNALGKTTGVLLDVGAGAGLFATYAKTLYQVAAIEPSPVACELLKERGIEHRQAEFLDVQDLTRNLDVIRLAWVLEHCLDPLAVLKHAYDHLVPGGVLSVIVPNEFNPLQNLLVKTHGSWFVHRSHINYFTPLTLFSLLGKAGFSERICNATYPMELFALTGMDYIEDSQNGKWAHEARKRFEVEFIANNLDKFFSWSQMWARAGLGRDIMMLAVK